MRVGILGTGAIANKHAQAYKNIGFDLVACSNQTEKRGLEFAERWGCELVPEYEDLCRYPDLDFIDVCTFPDFRLQPLEICAESNGTFRFRSPLHESGYRARDYRGRA